MPTNNKHYLDNDGALYLVQKILGLLSGKVDKVEGKGLSTNDYTTAEKTKLAGIESGANATTVVDALNSTSSTDALSAKQGKELDAKITNLANSMEDLGYGDMMKATYDADSDGVVDNAAALNGHPDTYFATKADIANMVEDSDLDDYLTKTGNGSDVTVTFTPATSRANLATGEKLSVLMGKLSKWFTDLKTVAFSGSYNDLTDKPSIPTVTNDLTNELKANYDAAYTHSQSAHAPANAQANVIETIKVNNTALTPTDKAVNIMVPTSVASFSDASNYALKSDITNVYKYKGSVATSSALPSSNQTTGDVYNVEDTGMNYAWNGTAWDALGEILTIESITNAEIDAMFAA